MSFLFYGRSSSLLSLGIAALGLTGASLCLAPAAGYAAGLSSAHRCENQSRENQTRLSFRTEGVIQKERKTKEKEKKK